jgi:hypothetical protein
LIKKLEAPNMSGGKTIIQVLKNHVADTMRQEPTCAPGARGLGNIELEALCNLELNLDSQDHYLTYSLLHALVKDGIVEQVRWPDDARHPKYRLR